MIDDPRDELDDNDPYTLGEEAPEPADGHLIDADAPVSRGVAAKEHGETELGSADERELWAKQRALIEEDTDDGLKLDGFPEDRIPAILDAMGDDAAEDLPGSPNGTSATGSIGGPDHGGFPERD
jgi:hypothetical protein